MKKHTCKYEVREGGFKCKIPSCKKFVSNEQAAVALTWGHAMFGEISRDNGKETMQAWKKLINYLAKRRYPE